MLGAIPIQSGIPVRSQSSLRSLSGCATKAQSYLLVTFPLSASAAVTYKRTTASALNVSQSIAKYADARLMSFPSHDHGIPLGSRIPIQLSKTNAMSRARAGGRRSKKL